MYLSSQSSRKAACIFATYNGNFTTRRGNHLQRYSVFIFLENTRKHSKTLENTRKHSKTLENTRKHSVISLPATAQNNNFSSVRQYRSRIKDYVGIRVFLDRSRISILDIV